MIQQLNNVFRDPKFFPFLHFPLSSVCFSQSLWLSKSCQKQSGLPSFSFKTIEGQADFLQFTCFFLISSHTCNECISWIYVIYAVIFFGCNLCWVKNEEELPLMPSETSSYIWFLMRFFHLTFTMIVLNRYCPDCHFADEGTKGQLNKCLVADHPACSETGTVSSPEPW